MVFVLYKPRVLAGHLAKAFRSTWRKPASLPAWRLYMTKRCISSVIEKISCALGLEFANTLLPHSACQPGLRRACLGLLQTFHQLCEEDVHVRFFKQGKMIPGHFVQFETLGR